MLAVARMVSRFLYVESCGQCRACKFGTGEITRHLDALAATNEASPNIEIIGQRLRDVTNQNRCFLGEEEQRVISSLLRRFPEEFTSETVGAASLETLPIPKIVDIRDGNALYDEAQQRKQPDWTYADARPLRCWIETRARPKSLEPRSSSG